jgi:hypothetical protein
VRPRPERADPRREAIFAKKASMRLGAALIGTCLALAIGGPGVARAQERDKAQDKREAAQAAQAAPEKPPPPPDEPLPPVSEARPGLPPAPPPEPVPWHNHLEVGGGLAVSELLAHTDGAGLPTPIRFRPAPGFHLDLSWQVFRFLRFTGYIQEHDHGLDFPHPGSLRLPGTITGQGALIAKPVNNVDVGNVDEQVGPKPTAHMYTFGFRFSPTLPIGSRGRLWLTMGVGWGRIEYPRYTYWDGAPSVCKLVVMVPNSLDNAKPCVTIRDRAENLFEVPFGVGGSFTIIPRWLSIHAEVTGSFIPSQSGDALDTGQFIDASGAIHSLQPMPKLDAAFTETIGLSLHL